MNTPILALIVISVAGLAVGTFLLPRYWRHDIHTFDAASDTPRGDIVEASMRAMPVAIAGGWIIVLGYVALALVPRDQPAASWIAFLVLSLGVLDFGLFLTIWSFNRPAVLVPPHLRDRPGALGPLRRSTPASPRPRTRPVDRHND